MTRDDYRELHVTDAALPTSQYWHDDPISDPAEDRFQRNGFAAHCANLIHGAHRPTSSVVYGLSGPWGSGKSSAIALLTQELTSNHREWRVVHFTPWATSDTDALLAEFYAALSMALPDDAKGKAAKEKLRTCADIARPLLTLIPTVGPAASEIAKRWTEREPTSWESAFREASGALQQVNIPVLVVVDDIDRLQPRELLDLLRVVRLLGRFPGVDYLLAYDEATLVATLQDRSRGEVTLEHARLYMEKIVQYPLALPELLAGKSVALLGDGLTKALGPERVQAFEAERFYEILQEVLPSLLRTPRAIDRFLAQVALQVQMHEPSEINDVDLILCVLLRMEFPELFTRLQEWKDPLLGRDKAAFANNDGKTDWVPLFDRVPVGRRQAAITVMETLFPRISKYGMRSEGKRRMSDGQYFDRYLAQSIPEGDIRDADISAAIAEAGSGQDARLRELTLGRDRDSAGVALSKIAARLDPRNSSIEDVVTADLVRGSSRLPVRCLAYVAASTVPDVKRWGLSYVSSANCCG